MNNQVWKFGNVQITKVLENVLALPPDMIIAGFDTAKLEEHRSWLHREFMNDEGMFQISMHSLVVESEGKTIVVDTCMGNDRDLPGGFGPLQTAYFDELNSAVDRLEVDYVLCTHLHFDHIGWNVMLQDGEWVPTFPNARYLFAKPEFDHWTGGAEHGYLDLSYGVDPIVAAGLHELVATDHQITSEIRLLSTPGHSPGHVSVVIESGGEKAIITGDMMHHPVQFAEPGWYSTADGDPEISTQTRQKFLDTYADQPVTVIGTHFAGPTSGRIITQPEGTRFVTD